MKKTLQAYRTPEITAIFFSDVAQTPVITGKSDYLPLTRRIERGRRLFEATGVDTGDTICRIRETLRDQIDELQYHIPLNTVESFLTTAAHEFEQFVDRPDWSEPPALAQLISHVPNTDEDLRTQIRTTAWLAYYLLALFPIAHRNQWNEFVDLDCVHAHFKDVRAEHDRCKQVLVEGTLRYAIKLATHYLHSGIPYDDLVQEGFLGLLHSIDRFEEVAGAHLQSYTANWIQQRIRRCIADQSRLIRVPVHLHDTVTTIHQQITTLTEELGYEPHEYELFMALGWLTQADVRCLQSGDTSAKQRAALSRYQKARRQMRYYRMAYATHYSLESTCFPNDEPLCRYLDEFLVAQDDPEQDVDGLLLHDKIEKLLTLLKPREVEVIMLRFGLNDGIEHTLEEIGQKMGVTRERIRQIEAIARRKLIHLQNRYKLADFNASDSPVTDTVQNRLHQSLLRSLDARTPASDDSKYDVLRERRRLQRMISRYGMQRRQRGNAASQFGSRAAMLTHVLEEAGEPLHYAIIHERLLENLPAELHYPKERTYASLFYRDEFVLLGEGVFALASWDRSMLDSTGETVLHHCPQPLLPDNADERAFFESIMVGRDLLQRKPDLTARNFYAEMQAWAKQSNNDWVSAQNAFDAWYGAGLINQLNTADLNGAPLVLTIPQGAKLADVRMHCLNALCRRINRMPELLLTIRQVARPTVSVIQKVLFGNEKAGFDVPYRLHILASFEAVQRTGNEWRLTPVGEMVLNTNPPHELPDFSVIDETVAEAAYENGQTDWEYDLGLLDI